MTQNIVATSMSEEGVDLPAASLLICSRNRAQLLWETIDSILQSAEVPAEMVIIDQSDAPDPRLAAYQPERDCHFRYLWSERKGVSLGRNMAAAAASHPILVFTDDDMRATADWFGLIARAAQAAGPLVAVTGRVLPGDDEGTEGFAPSTRDDEQVVQYVGRINRDVLFTNNMALRRADFDALGGFDERLGPGTPFPAAEDNEFAFRWLEAGGQIIYDPAPTMYHRAWRSEQEYIWLHWHYGYGQGAFYGKYLSLRDRHTLKRLLWDVWAYLSRFPLRFWRDRRQAYQDFLFATGILYGAWRWRRRPSGGTV
jgi:GT2 family glycosyltransferase